MTEPVAQQKKKFSPLVWVLIGCLGLLVLIGGCFAVTTFFVAKKAKDVIGDVSEDFQENPAMAAAEMFVKLNPELELVEADPEAETLTIRNKQTGEIATLDLAEVQAGRISFEGADGEEVTVGITQGDEGGPAGLTISGGEDDTTIEMGPGAEGDWPDWLEAYPGTTPEGAYATRAGGQFSGAFTMQTDDPVKEVLDFYSRVLDDAGLTPQVSSYSGPGSEGGSLNAQGESPNRNVGINVNRDEGGPTNIVVTFRESG